MVDWTLSTPDDIRIVDDFYGDPWPVRERALEASYRGRLFGPYPGQNSFERYLVPSYLEAMAEIVGTPLHFAGGLSTGRFRMTREDDLIPVDVHTDRVVSDWVGMVYLTHPDDCRGGTRFFRHKETGWVRSPSERELEERGLSLMDDFLLGDGLDRELWEAWEQVDMKFNRLVLFRCDLWHSHAALFGTRKSNARLSQQFPLRAGVPTAQFVARFPNTSTIFPRSSSESSRFSDEHATFIENDQPPARRDTQCRT